MSYLLNYVINNEKLKVDFWGILKFFLNAERPRFSTALMSTCYSVAPPGSEETASSHCGDHQLKLGNVLA